MKLKFLIFYVGKVQNIINQSFSCAPGISDQTGEFFLARGEFFNIEELKSAKYYIQRGSHFMVDDGQKTSLCWFAILGINFASRALFSAFSS